jgi:hypothetical protein
MLTLCPISSQKSTTLFCSYNDSLILLSSNFLYFSGRRFTKSFTIKIFFQIFVSHVLLLVQNPQQNYFGSLVGPCHYAHWPKALSKGSTINVYWNGRSAIEFTSAQLLRVFWASSIQWDYSSKIRTNATSLTCCSFKGKYNCHRHLRSAQITTSIYYCPRRMILNHGFSEHVILAVACYIKG